MLAAALAALIVSAAATLAVPLAVRRMIDLGFSGIDPDLIDKYFLTLAGIGLSSRWRAPRASMRSIGWASAWSPTSAATCSSI